MPKKKSSPKKKAPEADQAVWGRQGGLATKRSRGKDFYRKIAGMRKNRRGGRPRLHPKVQD